MIRLNLRGMKTMNYEVGVLVKCIRYFAAVCINGRILCRGHSGLMERLEWIMLNSNVNLRRFLFLIRG